MLTMSDAIFPGYRFQILDPPIPGVAAHPSKDFGRVPHSPYGTACGTIKKGFAKMKSLTPALDAAFKLLYSSGDWRGLAPAATQFFDSTLASRDRCDNFFENFTPVWKPLLDAKDYVAAECVWERALDPAIAWEQANGRFLHKGTAFYFWAVTALLRGDLDRGYLLMHQGLEEDKLNWGNLTETKPGFALVSIDSANPNQWFHQWVLDQARFLGDLLNTYTTSHSRVLDFAEFRRRFLSASTNLDTLFLFAHSVARIMQLKKVPYYSRQNPFAGQLGANVLFDIVLVIDAAIKEKNAAGTQFSQHAAFLLNAAGSTLTVGHLTNHVQTAFANFDPACKSILDGTFRLPGAIPPTKLERDVALAYGVRNRGAHDVSSSPILWQRFDEIQQALFNVLFSVVDYLYR